MRDVLHEVERALPRLLRSEEGWSSLDVDYHPPRVERVWRTVGPYRVSLHVIHPCEPGAALFHPHPWPSVMRVLTGRYEMGVGFGPGLEPPPVATTLVAEAPFEYEMLHPDGWHWVRPIGAPALSLMVTGPPWEREAPKSTRALEALRPERVEEILASFRSVYAPA